MAIPIILVCLIGGLWLLGISLVAYCKFQQMREAYKSHKLSKKSVVSDVEIE